MKIFISWSGSQSRAVADGLKHWLSSVLQHVEPWMSGDMEKGSRWTEELAKAISDATLGIVCVTPENLTSPWILFESGALTNALTTRRVCPFLFNVAPAEIVGPLAQFQATNAVVKSDVLRLLEAINNASGSNSITPSKLEQAFEKWWPDLEQAISGIPSTPVSEEDRRSDRELLEEILNAVRGRQRDDWTSEPGLLLSPDDFSVQRYQLRIPWLRKRLTKIASQQGIPVSDLSLKMLPTLNEVQISFMNGIFSHAVIIDLGVSADEINDILAEFAMEIREQLVGNSALPRPPQG